MDNELEKEIERQKTKISDYLRLAPAIGIDKEEREKQIDLMLKDLARLMKKRK